MNYSSEKQIKVLIADSSEDFRTMLSDFIEGEEDMCVCFAAESGETALKAVFDYSPNVLVTDLILQHLDGLSLIRELRSCGMLPPTIVVSGFFNDNTAACISRMGAEYFFPKPCRVQELVTRIRQCTCIAGAAPELVQSFDSEVSEALLNLGIMPHLQGYRFLKDGVKHTIVDRNNIRGITKILYPELAKKYHTTPKCVERSIRNAIETAWKNGDSEQRTRYFGCYAANFERKPTNSRLIATLAEFIECGRERQMLGK